MTMKGRATMSLVAVFAGLVGMVAFLAGPASADDGHHNDSTASGDAVAIDGSVASGCSTAVRESTASGADHCKSDRGKDKHDHEAGPAKAHHGDLALTGSSSASMVQMALVAFFAGLALVSFTNIFRHQNQN
jgi:hypothetical protein